MNAALWLLLFRGGAIQGGVDGPYKLAAREVYVPGVAAAQVYVTRSTVSEVYTGGVASNEVVT